MKKILIAAALGMLLSAVSVTAQDFEDWGGDAAGVSPDVTALEVLQQQVQAAETVRDEALREAQAAETARDKALREAQAAQAQIEQDRIAVKQEKAKQEQAEKDWKEKLQAVLDEADPTTGVPKWVTNLSILDKVLAAAKQDGVFVGIGSATNKRDYQAIQMAEARARQDIAFQRDALIKAEITDYAESMEGVKGQSNSLSSAAEEYIVGRQSVETKLPSAAVVKRQKQPATDTWWVIVTAAIPGIGKDLKNEGAVTFPYETKVAPKAVGEMEQNLSDQRVGRSNLKPTVSPAVSSESASETVSE